MRPYLAIIKDSFREAIASRVLWVMLGLITLVLVALAPMTYREEVTVGLQQGEIEAWPELVEKLQAASKDEAPSPARRVWSLLDESGKKTVLEFKGLPEKPTLRDVRDFGRVAEAFFKSLDQMIRRDDFYDKASWKGIGASTELKQLQKTDYQKLAPQDRLRFNRLLLEAAFPDQIPASPPTSFQFRYAFWDLAMPLPMRKSQLLQELVDRLPWLIDKFILSIGLIIAVLVTAPIIPQMFDPSALHLLLSKPISRPVLYLTKFLGGCAFVLVFSTYLFVGLWLIFGIQWGLWEGQLLWCIPVYVFVFAIYYSVAALAGAIWRNTIVAIIATVVFWGICWLVGLAHDSTANTMLRYRIGRIVPLKDQVAAVDEVNTLLSWNAEKTQWTPVFATPEQEQVRMVLVMFPEMLFQHPPPMIGPVYDERNDQVVGATISFKSLGRMVMVSAKPSKEKWKLTEGAPSPGQPIAIVMERDDHPLLVTNGGLYRVQRDVSTNAIMLRMPGLTIPLARAESLAPAGPDPAQYWSDPSAAALDPSTGKLTIFSRDRLWILNKREDGKYAIERDKKLFDEDRDPVLLAASGGRCYVARKNGEIVALESKSLAEAGKFKIPSESPPRALAATPDGQGLFVLCHDGYLHRLDAKSGRFSRPVVRGQGNISAIAVDKADMLYVASRATRVIQYDLATMKQVQAFDQPLDFQERAHYYVIVPAHAILPKPGEFYKTVQYLMSGKQTSGKDAGNLATAQKDLDPWSPIWSGLLFQAVMLGLGCLYIHWQEF
jgi:hypothetical protein